MEELEQIFADLDRSLILSVIANKFEAKTSSAQEVLGVLQEDYQREMYETGKCEEFNIASKKKIPVATFEAKNSPAFEDILEFVREFMGVAVATPA